MTLSGLLAFQGARADGEREKDYGFYLLKLRQTDMQSQSDSALYFAGQLMEHSLLPDSMAINLLRIGDIYRVRNDYALARSQLALFDSLFHAYGLNDSLLLAKKIYLQAKILTTQGAFIEALPIYDSSIQIKSRLLGPDHIRLAKVYNYKGINYHYMHNYDEAMRNYQKGLEICILNDVEGIDMADIMQNMAILHTNKSEFELALEANNRSKQIREAIFPKNDARLATFYINYGRFLNLLGDMQQSLSYYEESERILLIQTDINELALGTLYINMGIIFELKRDLQKANTYYQQSILRLSNVVEEVHPLLISAKNNLGAIKLSMGDHHEAMNLFDGLRGLELNPFSRLVLLRNYAAIYTDLGNLDLAENYFSEAIDFAERAFGDNHYELANSYLSFGDFLLSRRKPSQALTYFEEARQIFVSNFGETDKETGYVLINMARCYNQLGEYVLADQLMRKVDTLFQPVVDQIIRSQAFENLAADVRIVGYPATRASLYKEWYEQDNDIEKLFESLKWIEQGMQLVDRIGMGTADESRIMLNEQVRELLDDALEISYTLFQITSDTSILDHAFELSGVARLLFYFRPYAGLTPCKPEGCLLRLQNWRVNIMSRCPFSENWFIMKSKSRGPIPKEFIFLSPVILT